MRRNAASQERIARTQEDLAKAQIERGDEDRALSKEMFEQIRPVAEMMLQGFDPEQVYGNATPFPDIQRPDFTGMIRNDYADDRAAIDAGKNQSLAQLSDHMTATGMSRMGISGLGIGSIMRGAEGDQSLARRNMQSRLEGEARDAYADSRDLALMKHSDQRALGDQRAQIATAGANIMSGQQATFNPGQWYNSGMSGYNAAGGLQGGAAQTRYNAARLPGALQTIGGLAGGIAGSAIPGIQMIRGWGNRGGGGGS